MGMCTIRVRCPVTNGETGARLGPGRGVKEIFGARERERVAGVEVPRWCTQSRKWVRNVVAVWKPGLRAVGRQRVVWRKKESQR